MERVPEPELMEEKEQVISYDEADFSEGEVNLINQINQYLLKKNISTNKKKLKNLRYICSDIKDIKSNNFLFKKRISLLVSNSLIHHITNLEDFFNTIRSLSSNVTVNFHKDLKRPLDEKSALELKAQCSKKYNEILTNDYYASLRASYTLKELKTFTLENDLSSLDVFEEGDNYLIVYGNV